MRVRDVLVATGCAVVSIGTLVVAEGSGEAAAVVAAPEAGWFVVVATLLAQAVLLVGVRDRPRAVLVATATLAVVAGVAGAGDATSVATLAVVVATYVVATTRPWPEVWPPVALATVLVATADALGSSATGAAAVLGGIAQATSTLGLTLLVALIVSTRRETLRTRQRLAEATAREQQALVQAAIARERTAMARELHDIAAHHLSGIAVMTGAIGAQIDTDPAGAKTAVAEVRDQSRAVLRDLRSLVGLLREGDGSDEVRPENLAGIDGLVADAARTGRDVGLTVLTGDGELGHGVGPLAQLAAYRVAQEALANAVRHAPGAPCEVIVDDRDADAVLLEVRNGPSTSAAEGPSGGFGLIGMRERAELTRATLEIGPADDGGWRVAMRLPRDEVGS